jgi:hypothetical protein
MKAMFTRAVLTGFALGVAATVAFAAPASAAVYVPVWSTNFDTNQVFQTMGPFASTGTSYSAGGASFTNSQSLPGFGTRYLRNSTNGTTSFTVSGLEAHDALRLQFDLAFLDSWDRPDDTRWGPDYLFVTVGSSTYQYAPTAWPGDLVGRGSYAANGSWQDSVHRLDFLVPHSDGSFTFSIRAGGGGYQGGNDESWGIDNIRLSASAVPEPASWAMLILGFGLVGGAMRRRRADRIRTLA